MIKRLVSGMVQNIVQNVVHRRPGLRADAMHYGLRVAIIVCVFAGLAEPASAVTVCTPRSPAVSASLSISSTTYPGSTTITASATTGLQANCAAILVSPLVIMVNGTQVASTTSASLSYTLSNQVAGSYAIYAEAASAYKSTTQTLTVSQLGQTISGFAPATPVAYSSGKTIALSATGGGSGNGITYAASPASVCSVSGSTLTLKGPGTCALTANQAGNTNYSAAAQVSANIVVTGITQAITGFAPASPVVYSVGGTFPLTATGGASGNAVTFGTTTGSVCTVSAATVTLQSVGTCTLTANQAAAGNYSAAPQVIANVVITAAAQTITSFTPTSPVVYSANGTFTLTATGGASGSAVTFSSTTPTVCTVANATVTLKSIGTCALTANQAASGNYSAAPQVSANVVITAGTQTITGFGPASPVMYSANGTFTLTATGGASGSAVTFGTTTGSVCTVANATVTLQSVGTCTLTANQAAAGNYNAAAQVSANVLITAGTQTITGFAPTTPVTYSPGGTFSLSATGGASGSAVTFGTTTPSVCTVANATAAIVTTGTCTLTANQTGSASYNAAAQVTANVVITAATQTITGFSPASPVAYSANGTFVLTATGGASGSALVFGSTTPSVCTVVNTTATLVSVGTCTLTADQPGNADYSAAVQVSQSVIVTQGVQVITFNTINSQTAGETPITVTATSSAGLAVTLTSATTTVCSVSGSQVTLITAGSCTLTAGQSGTSLYAAAQPVSQTFSVVTNPVTISISSPVANQQLEAPVNLRLTASVSDATGTITQVAFYNGAALMGTVTQAPYTITIPDAIAGTYQITAQATDSNGLTATSAVVNVTVAANVSGEQVYYINADQLNTPRLITNSTGTTVWQWDGEAFGNTPPQAETTGTGPFVFNLRFPGQYFDAETNLFYNYYRDYNPATGSYIESDPIGLAGGQASTYAYVGDHPLSYFDFFGLDLTPAQQQAIVTAAQDWSNSGVSYVFGGTTKNGADCSGSISSIYAQAGIYIGRLTSGQFANTPFTPVTGSPQVGDVGVYSGHVVIYGGGAVGVNGDNVWSASHTGGPVFGPANSAWYGTPKWYRYNPPVDGTGNGSGGAGNGTSCGCGGRNFGINNPRSW